MIPIGQMFSNIQSSLKTSSHSSKVELFDIKKHADHVLRNRHSAQKIQGSLPPEGTAMPPRQRDDDPLYIQVPISKRKNYLKEIKQGQYIFELVSICLCLKVFAIGLVSIPFSIPRTRTNGLGYVCIPYNLTTLNRHLQISSVHWMVWKWVSVGNRGYIPHIHETLHNVQSHSNGIVIPPNGLLSIF